MLPKLVDTLKTIQLQRTTIAVDRKDPGRAPSFHGPDLDAGVGVRTGARILFEVGASAAFKTPGHLAAYAGIAPVTHRSGSSIRA